LNTDPKGEDGAEPGAAVPTVRPPWIKSSPTN
jgi:hypothetical protein